MKQTNSAIKFLMAQYRAIFQKAYLKGLVSAVALTTGFAAASSANAGTVGFAEWSGHDSSSQYTVQSGDVIDIFLDDNKVLNTGLTLDKVSTSETEGLERISALSNSLTLTSKGDLSIGDNRRLDIGYGSDSNAGGVTNVTFENATVSASGTLSVFASNFSTGSGTSTLNIKQNLTTDGDIIVYATSKGTATLNAKTISAANGASISLNAGDATHDAVVSGETIEITGATLAFDSHAGGNASVQGNNLTIGADGLLLTSSGSNNKIESVNFTVEAGAGQVVDGNSVLTYTGTKDHGAYGSIAGNLLVEAGSSFKLNAFYDEMDSGASVSKDYYGETVSVSDDSNNYDGKFDAIGGMTIESGANVQLAGTLNVGKGTLTIESGANLNATAAANGSNLSGSILISNSGTTGLSKGTLEISAATLGSFLAADDSYNPIDPTTGKLQDPTTLPTDFAGAVVISGSGLLYITDQEQVDLNDFYFKSGTAANGTSGTITVVQGEVSGKNLLVSHKLESASGSTLSQDADLRVRADHLTLGDGTANGLTAVSGSGFKRFSAQRSLAVNVKDNGYFTVNGVGNNTLTNSSATEIGQVNGNLALQIDSSNVDNLLTMRGNWDVDGNLKFLGNEGTRKSLVIGRYASNPSTPAALETDKYNSYDTYVTVDGKVINEIGPNGGNATILVKDYYAAAGSVELPSSSYATLDLTNATLESNATNIAAQNNAGALSLIADINGTIKITGSQLSDIVADSNNQLAGFALAAAQSGIIAVNDSVTGEINFDRFLSTNKSNGSDYVNRVNLSNKGILDVNGSLSLFTGDPKNNQTQSSALNIGTGTIKAKVINLTNYQVSGTGEKAKPVDTNFASGVLEVSENLTVNKSSNFVVGGSGDTGVVLNTLDVARDGTLSQPSKGGALTIANASNGGTIKLDGSAHEAYLAVQTGNWSTTADIDANGTSGDVTIGLELDNFNNSYLTQDQKDAYKKYVSDADKTGSLVAEFTGDHFKSTGANLNVLEESKATFNTMHLDDSSNVEVEGHLVVAGRDDIKNVTNDNKNTDPAYSVNIVSGASTTAGIALGQANISVDGTGAVLEFGNVATNALINLNGETDAGADGSKIVITKGGIDNAQFNVQNFGQLKFNFDEKTKLSTDDIKFLINDLNVGNRSTTGFLNLGNADLGFNYEEADGLVRIKWNNLKDFVNVIGSQATTDKLMLSQVYDISASDTVRGHYGSLSVNVSNTGIDYLTLDGATSLHNAATFGNKFVINQTNGEALGIKFTTGASLWLENGGEIGSITGNGTYNGSDDVNNLSISSSKEGAALTDIQGSVSQINEFTVESQTQVKDNVDVNYLEVISQLDVLGNNHNLVKTNGGDISSTGVLNTKQLQVGKAVNQNASNGILTVMGQVNASESITLTSGSSLDIFGGSVTTQDLTGESGSFVAVGYDATSLDTEDDKTTIYDEIASYTGSLEVTGTAVFNGGDIGVDPEYGMDTAFASLNNLKSSNDSSLIAGTLDGSAFVGQNAVLGIGSKNLAFLKDEVSQFMHGNTLAKDDVGAIIYLGKTFTLGQNESIILTAEDVENFIKHYNDGNGSATDLVNYTKTTDADPFVANTFYLGANTSIVVGEDAFTKTDTKRGNQALITFAGSGNNAKGTVIADGGDIRVNGNVRASTYQVFANADIKYLDGTAYTGDKADAAYKSEYELEVSTLNDFLVGIVQADGSVKLGVASDGRNIMRGASTPVYNTLVAYANGYNGEPTKNSDGTETIDESQYLYDGYTDQNNSDGTTSQVKNYTYNNDVLQETIALGDGSTAETVARLGIYGGSVQAAISAGATTSDAVAGRMGMGAQTGAVTFADNGQGAGLWVTPIYKSHDSDGFGAQGLTYGTDMSMYGLALGGDFTMANGMRVGAAFNVGSGDADGQGAGAGVSNDFDYYGFTVYGGFTMDKMSVVADISYTAVDNDVSANTSLGKVSSTMDTTNMSFGVTGQYTLSMDAVDIVPHAGLRYTYVDMDDYTVKSDTGDQAHYAGDSMSIFSIPVGVTFSKDIVAGSWTVKPAFDLTLTANVGDDSIDGSVTWAGVDNLKTNLESEVVDSFTYGATLGVSAKSGNFSMGFGVNYTGASNADEYGVNANARFVF